jgi:hypothetical protein
MTGSQLVELLVGGLAVGCIIDRKLRDRQSPTPALRAMKQ